MTTRNGYLSTYPALTMRLGLLLPYQNVGEQAAKGAVVMGTPGLQQTWSAHGLRQVGGNLVDLPRSSRHTSSTMPQQQCQLM